MAMVVLPGLAAAQSGEARAANTAESTQTAEPARTQDSQEAALPVVRLKVSDQAEAGSSYTAGASRSATGLQLSLRDTPQSVTVIGRQRIEDQAMNSIADALQFTPGVSLKAVDRGRNGLSVRGFDISSFQYDGVPVATGNIGGETGSTAIYERIEVVRGATGLLSGAGNPSASVNLVRKRASSKHFTGTVTASLGSAAHRSLGVDLSTPLSEDGRVRGRLVASSERQNAFIELENTRRNVLYGVIEADLGPRTELRVGASSQSDKRNGIYWGGLPYWYADGSRSDWAPSKTTATRWNQWDTRQQTAFAQLSHRLESGWRLRLDLNRHEQQEESMLLWLTGEPARDSGLGMQARAYHYRARPVQNQLALTAGGHFRLWGREHELLLGLSHSRARGGWDNADPLGEAAPVGNFLAWDGSYARPQMGPLYVGSRETTVQTGGYAAVRLQLSDAAKLILGSRLSRWQQDNERGAWTTEPFVIAHSDVLTPYAGLLYDLSDSLSAYASTTSIFNPQNQRDRFGNYLAPLEGKSHEAGLKGEFLDSRLNASVAIFRIDQENFAVSDPGATVPGTSTPAMRAARGVRAQGYELELQGELGGGWSVGAGWTQYSARDAQGQDVAQEHPRRQLKLFGKHVFSGALAGFSAGAGLHWQSRPPVLATNPATAQQQAIGQPAYGLVDLMLGYAISPQAAVQLHVDNLLDKRYYDSSWSGYTMGKPREFKLTASYRL